MKRNEFPSVPGKKGFCRDSAPKRWPRPTRAWGHEWEVETQGEATALPSVTLTGGPVSVQLGQRVW